MPTSIPPKTLPILLSEYNYQQSWASSSKALKEVSHQPFKKPSLRYLNYIVLRMLMHNKCLLFLWIISKYISLLHELYYAVILGDPQLPTSMSRNLVFEYLLSMPFWMLIKNLEVHNVDYLFIQFVEGINNCDLHKFRILIMANHHLPNTPGGSNISISS